MKYKNKSLIKITLKRLKPRTQCGDSPVKILKQSIDIYLAESTEWMLSRGIKNGRGFPIFKTKDSLVKENFRSVNILSHVLKIFERIMYKQIEI